MSTQVLPDNGLLVTETSRVILRSGMRLRLLSDPPGVVENVASRYTYLSIHVGPTVEVACARGGFRHRGRAVHGDIDIIPAGVASRWEIAEQDTALVLGISPVLLRGVADELSDDLRFDPGHLEIRNRFQIRDVQLESIAWALKSEMESGFSCGRIYLESLATAAAARLIRFHSSAAGHPEALRGGLSGRRLKQVLSYLEDNLAEEITLVDLAALAGISTSHFKTLFRQSMGVPVHQYLIRRRIERARSLLLETELPLSRIAVETGFSHPSHLARHMRRVLGVPPGMLRDRAR